MKRILLAGPGTGKTSKVKKDFLSGVKDFGNVLVLSFTNATINDLIKSFAKDGIPITDRNCMTLHSYALKVNHQRDLHVLNNYEERVLRRYAEKLGVEFRLFCEMLRSITYGQMITDFIEFAKSNPVYLKERIGNIGLLIVDEFQDFNEVEQELVHMIAEHAQDTLILGDDDQCIYDFKDATSDGIIALYNDPAVENIKHENICYRCPEVVVEKGKNLISNNKKRIAKDWHPNGKAGSIQFEQKSTMSETVEWVIQKIKQLREADPSKTIIILSPVNLAVEAFPEKLERAEIPYLNFFGETMDTEVYKKIWRLRLIYTQYKLLNLILIVDCSDLSDYKKQKFRNVLKSHIAEDFTFTKIQADVEEFLDKDIIAYLKEPPDFDGLLDAEPWNTLKELISKTGIGSARDRLEKIERYANPPVQFNPELVNIMSIHKSKGLEADHVFILGLVDGILPRKADGVESMEEQRRMFFVGITRTRKHLYLLSTVRWDARHVYQLGKEKFTQIRSGGRHFNARTSPFIGELKLDE